MNPELAPGALIKPRRGDAKIALNTTKRSRKTAEEEVMDAAVRRDHGKCRFPRCEFAKEKLKIDPVHFLEHRGMGGNPKGDRTSTTGQIVALCRKHHDMLDRYLEIEVHAIDPVRLADGPLAFHEVNPVTGRMEHVHTEPINFFSETRGA